MSHRTLTSPDRRQDWLPALLLGAVLVFAFLATSFLENSGEFWSHLASGRRLVGDDFSFANVLRSPGVFNLVLYTIFQGTGGIALVALKAFGFAVLAWLLLPPRARRTEATSLVACTLLSLLALSPYASLRPAIVSCFFLALTLRILLSTQEREWYRFLLGPLFVLWVNLDRWFWLGPLLVLLFWMGQRLDGLLSRDSRQTEGKERIPVWLPLACALLCLPNPLGIRAFALPSAWLSPPWWAASPWQPERLVASIQRIDLAALAYPLLVGLGLVSLVLPGARERGPRTLVWGSLALLSSWQSAMIPFFAVVAAPITALNWQDRLALQCRMKTASDSAFGTRHSAFINEWVLLAGSLVLSFLAAIGGLHGLPHTDTIPGWGVDADVSSRQFVQTIHRWRQQDWLRADDRFLLLPGKLATCFPWFAPEEQLTNEQYHDLPAVELACRGGKGNLVAVDDPDLMRKLAGDPEHWLLLHVEGRITLWGWKDACLPRSPRQPFTANRLIFASDDSGETPLLARTDSALQNFTPVRTLLDRLAPRSGPLGPDSEAASTYLRYFQAGVLPPYQRNRSQNGSVSAASLIAAPPPHALSVLLRLEQASLLLREIEKDLPDFPLLAIRAARRALAAHPDDASAYLSLGQAYRYLWETTGERDRCRATSLLAELRQAQAAAALEQAARLDPQSQAAHQLLAELYQEQGYLDAALDHRREEARLTQRAGSRRGEDQKAFARRLQRLEQQSRALEGMVRERQKRFAALPASVTQPSERAAAALRLGLAKLALDEILLPSSPVLLESSGVNMELELLLRLGRVEQLREWMQGPDLQLHGTNLGLHNLPAPSLPGYPFSYRLPAACWFRFLWTAAQGDYDSSQAQMHEMLDQLESTRQEQLRSLRRSLALSVANEMLLSAQPELLFLQVLGHKDTVAATHLLNPVLSFGGTRADLCVLAGLLSLESGNTRQAEKNFEMAVDLGRPLVGDGSDFAARPLADFFLQRLRVPQARQSGGSLSFAEAFRR